MPQAKPGIKNVDLSPNAKDIPALVEGVDYVYDIIDLRRDAVSGVIEEVVFRITASDGIDSMDTVHKIALPPPAEGANIIPFDEVNEQDVIRWVKSFEVEDFADPNFKNAKEGDPAPAKVRQCMFERSASREFVNLKRNKQVAKAAGKPW